MRAAVRQRRDRTGRPSSVRGLQLPVVLWLTLVWVALWGSLSVFNVVGGLLVGRYCVGVVWFTAFVVSEGMLVRHIDAIVRSGILPEVFTRKVAMSSLARGVRTVKWPIAAYALSMEPSICTWRLVLRCVVGIS